MKAIIILSGGIDSTTVLYDAIDKGYEVEAISFDYGQKHSKEIYHAKWHCKQLKIPHKIINLDFSCFNSSLLQGGEEIPEGHYESKKMKSTVVPFRNGIMLAYAIGYAENIKANCVLIGSHAGDHAIYPDCTPEFNDGMRHASVYGTYNHVEIKAPFNTKTKADIIKRGTELNIPYDKTWSCYKGGEKACGKCGTCVERIEAFEKNKLEDPIEYIKS